MIPKTIKTMAAVIKRQTIFLLRLIYKKQEIVHYVHMHMGNLNILQDETSTPLTWYLSAFSSSLRPCSTLPWTFSTLVSIDSEYSVQRLVKIKMKFLKLLCDCNDVILTYCFTLLVHHST